MALCPAGALVAPTKRNESRARKARVCRHAHGGFESKPGIPGERAPTRGRRIRVDRRSGRATLRARYKLEARVAPALNYKTDKFISAGGARHPWESDPVSRSELAVSL